jgi:hypothetical protein
MEIKLSKITIDQIIEDMKNSWPNLYRPKIQSTDQILMAAGHEKLNGSRASGTGNGYRRYFTIPDNVGEEN